MAHGSRQVFSTIRKASGMVLNEGGARELREKTMEKGAWHLV
jgi:hypothetical protein